MILNIELSIQVVDDVRSQGCQFVSKLKQLLVGYFVKNVEKYFIFDP
jgi:hypothetical protein